MAIIEDYDESLFISRFEDYKRVINSRWEGGNFTYKGLRVLFEYLDNLSDDTGEDIKLDIIGLCCDYSEYKNLKEYLTDYSNQHTTIKEITGQETITNLNKEELNELNAFIENEINNKTTLIKFEDNLNEGFIIQNY